MHSLDQVVWSNGEIHAARFRCGVDDLRFRDSGPIRHHSVVFPRTAVRLQYAGSQAFVADPSVATVYNKGQEYIREPVTAEGDRCEWLGVSPHLAIDIASAIDPRALDTPDRPFPVERVHIDRQLYLRQRRLFRRLDRQVVDPLEAEETIIDIVGSTLASTAVEAPHPPGASRAHRDLAERAKEEICRNVTKRVTLMSLARTVCASPFHLARIFRAYTGTTIHQYQLELRIRMAMEIICDPALDVARTAESLGFSSHSHLTSVMRRRFGRTPSQIRALLSY